ALRPPPRARSHRSPAGGHWSLPGRGSYPLRRRSVSPRGDATRRRKRKGGHSSVTIRVVLADDNVLVREGVRALLDASDGIEVVGVADDAPSLLAKADELEPDVVITDIKMPPLFQLEGINCAHDIREKHPGTGVVVLSAHDDEAYALALLGHGQSGLAYLLKDRIAQGDELVLAITEVAAGGSRVDPTIAARLSDRKETDDEGTRVLEMMATGLTYADMARELQTTEEALDRK